MHDAVQMQFHATSFANQPYTFNDDNRPISRSDNTFVQEPTAQYAPASQPSINFLAGSSDMLIIDPASMSPVASSTTIYQNGFYGVPPVQQYTRSYERYRALTPTAISAQPPAISRVSVQGSENPISLPGEAASTISARSVAVQNVDRPAYTPPLYCNGKDDGASPGVGDFGRPVNYVRYHYGQEVNSPFYDPKMPPPNVVSYTGFVADPQAADASIARPASSVGTLLTLVSSHSDDGYKVDPSKVSTPAAQASPDLRRLSVSSLLSGSSGISY